MKKTVIAVLISILTVQLTISQTSKNKEEYSKALSYVSTGNSFNSLGNFASLSTANNTLNASLFFLDDKNGMYTVDIKAGATQGVFALFDEGKLNSNVSIGFSYRFLFENEYVGYNLPDQIALDEEISSAEEEYIQKKIEFISNLENPKLTAKDKVELDEFIKKTDKIFDIKENINVALSKETLKKLKKVDALYKKVIQDISSNNNMAKDYTAKEMKKLRSSLENERERLIQRVRFKNDEKNKLKIYGNVDTQLIRAKNKKINDIKKKIAELKPRFIRLNFLSFGYKATNSRFIRFIDSLEASKQLKNTNYTSHNFNVSYNLVSNISKSYNATNYKYLSMGANFTYSDNQSSLEQIDVIDRRFISDDQTREVSKTQKAFLGEYIEDLAGVTVFADYYSFFTKTSDFSAFHINPSVHFKENQKPIANMQLGILIPFTKKEDKKSIVNLEIFYRFKDIFNNLDSNNTILNRNIIGLQTSFPFNI